jgi:hypothetical protein
MNTYRAAALALVTGVAAWSLTACTAGSTTASSPATSPGASSQSASAAASSPAPVVAASTVTISGSLGSFPVPAGAKVAEKVDTSQEILVFFSGISPAKVSAFYAAALPQAGYAVTGNTLIRVSGVSEALIQFTGHGYTGNIATLAKFNGPSLRIAGLGHKNVTTISLAPH